MALLDIYHGRQTWTDFISGQSSFVELKETNASQVRRKPPAGVVALELRAADYRLAVESGLGALRAAARHGELAARLELGVEKLAGGLAELKADFNLLLGDLAWKFEMQQETLTNILQEIRLAEFEREARAYRARAERAYL
ncbi:MAG: hypothetical protein ACREBD_04720, partial [Blastocatellia bacterium]